MIATGLNREQVVQLLVDHNAATDSFTAGSAVNCADASDTAYEYAYNGLVVGILAEHYHAPSYTVFLATGYQYGYGH